MNQTKVLIVDDEPHILHVMGLKLNKAGYEVLTAADGDQALTQARDHRPSLVITDYQMPVMSGLTLCEKLREIPGLGGMPVLLVTAHGFGLDRTLLGQTNIAEVISKPFSPREVLDKVQALTQSKTLTQEAA